MPRSEHYNLLKRPLATEKTMQMAELGQYVFEVNKTANKVELTKAFEMAFPGRKVLKVRTVKIPHTTRRVGKKTGRVPSGRKAIFSITGDPIEITPGG